MPDQIAEGSHVADIALTREIARRVAQLALAMSTRIVVDARSLILIVQAIVVNHHRLAVVLDVAHRTAAVAALGILFGRCLFGGIGRGKERDVVRCEQGLVQRHGRRLDQGLHVVVLVAVLAVRDAKCGVFRGEVTRDGRV